MNCILRARIICFKTFLTKLNRQTRYNYSNKDRKNVPDKTIISADKSNIKAPNSSNKETKKVLDKTIVSADKSDNKGPNISNKETKKSSSDKTVVSAHNSDIKGPFFIAAHASTGFCRAGLVNDEGILAKIALEPCTLYHSGVFYEVSSDQVWSCLVDCIKKLSEGVNKNDIKAICFTARPALVCVDNEGKPVTASVSRDPSRNVILHYDQRSMQEVEKINKTRHNLLQYFGERALPELQESKIMWLKNNLEKDCWKKVGSFFELTDFLTWKATGSQTRSSSILTSNWSYEVAVNGVEGWNRDFFKEIGLEELENDDWKKIGSTIQAAGLPVGEGLSASAAEEIGLPKGLPIATSMLDQYAGYLGLLGIHVDGVNNDITKRLCIIMGDVGSSHFILSPNPVFVKGVWGPFKDVVLPNMWLNQAGQPTSQGLIQHIIDNHPSSTEIRKKSRMHIQKYLNKLLKVKAQQRNLKCRSYLTRDLHILPDFNGNRSPLADPLIRGMVTGLSMYPKQEDLAILYLATLQALTYSTKNIINTLTHYGHEIKSIFVSGTMGKNSLFSILQADVCRVPMVSPDQPNNNLIGAAILGAVASGHYRTFNEATTAMGGKGKIYKPDEHKELIDYHNRKFEVFLKLYEHQLQYRSIMSGSDITKEKMQIK
ncbi:FGGY carbohydrate kinase domain-containing protein-like isoform X2 [Sitophilus oryzae]|uniref:FGGY carbohydrate kinase domain-containing protein-like isoform X2 n=1 Tax=Sitophilus oryzae TaxID=7048 RepID=A0A6J2X9Y9_SITOR|nr:FGGY carbohydrate kinase domain-containing protein-like isoform X2 [Sitophilus oryzae]